MLTFAKQSTADTDGNIISFVGIWSRIRQIKRDYISSWGEQEYLYQISLKSTQKFALIFAFGLHKNSTFTYKFMQHG